LAQGQAVSVKVNYDPGWRAEQDGRPIPIERDALGFILLRANASPLGRIHLKYRGTLEQYSMGVLSAMVWIAALVRLLFPPAGKILASFEKKMTVAPMLERSSIWLHSLCRKR
jgi:hypothetical protein